MTARGQTLEGKLIWRILRMISGTHKLNLTWFQPQSHYQCTWFGQFERMNHYSAKVSTGLNEFYAYESSASQANGCIVAHLFHWKLDYYIMDPISKAFPILLLQIWNGALNFEIFFFYTCCWASVYPSKETISPNLLWHNIRGYAK